jgi:hypothetical protein
MKKKVLLPMVCLALLVFVLSGVSYAWEGRMGGVGDPYGLLSDESDFLIHPAKIANGEGVKFYGDYRFTYTGVTDWDYNLDRLTPAGVLTDFFHYDTSGQEYRHDVLVGAGFPLGPGRMGLFFQYDGMRGDYDGNEDILGTSNYAEYDLTKDLDNFALRLLYGLPIGGGFNLGGEAQFAYRQEEQETWINQTDLFLGISNYPWGGSRPWLNLFPFMFPYDSHYWEALLKGSLEGKVGPLDLEFTLRGGFVFGGDNKYEYDYQQPVSTSLGGINMDGAVQGWRIGGDLWLRYPMTESLALPFLVRVDYQSKTRDGDAEGYGALAGYYYNYEQEERNLHIEAGGGMDKTFSKNTRVAAGIYYNYLQGEENVRQWGIESSPFINDHSYPASTEHRVMLRLTGELELSPAVTLRMGLVPFIGWVREDFKYYHSSGNFTDDITLDGSHWGIGGSVGGSVQFDGFTMEPFFNVGWQQYDLDGNGDRTSGGAITDLWDMDKSRDEWYIGGGCSFLYDLP